MEPEKCALSDLDRLLEIQRILTEDYEINEQLVSAAFTGSEPGESADSEEHLVWAAVQSGELPPEFVPLHEAQRCGAYSYNGRPVFNALGAARLNGSRIDHPFA